MYDFSFSVTHENENYFSIVEVHDIPQFKGDKIVEACIKSVGNPDVFPSPNVNDLIAVFEEQMLADLQDDYTVFTNLQGMMERLMKDLKVNFYLYIGHINMCEDFLKTIDEQIVANRKNAQSPLFSWPFNDAPVIVLFIACQGKQVAEEANQKETWQQTKFVAMGFNDLVHIYKGEIYGCKLPHRTQLNMSCFYDGAEEDYKKLIDTIGSNLDDINLLRSQNNPLVSCCDSKYDRFRAVFLQNLRKRNCAKFSEEKIKQKIQGFITPSGEINQDALKNSSSFLFSYEDGISCDDESQCKINNPYENSIKVAESYNARSSLLNLFNEFEELAKTELSRNQKDEQVLKKLQNLRPEEKKIFNYRKNNITLCHIFGEYGLLKSIQYIIKKEPPNFSLQSSINGDTLLHAIVQSPYIQDPIEIMPFIYKAFQINPDSLGIRNNENEDILSLAVKFQYYILVEFFAAKTSFDFAMSNYGDGTQNLLFLSFFCYPWFGESAYKMVKLLLVKGINPNDVSSYGDILMECLTYWNPPFSSKILKELCYWGYSKKDVLEWGILYFSEILNNPVKEIQYQQKLQASYNIGEKNLEDPTIVGIKRIMNENEIKIIDLLFLDFKGQLKETIKTLKDCIQIINKGGKKNTQILATRNRTVKNVIANINAYNIRYEATEWISQLYKNIDEFLKTVGALFKPEEKKAYRSRLRTLLTNQSRNIVDRYQDMRKLNDEIDFEAFRRGHYPNVSSNNGRGYNSYGGKRKYRKTRKNLKKRKTLRKSNH